MEKRFYPRKTFINRIGFDLTGDKKGSYERISSQGVGIDICSGGMGMITDQALEEGRVLKLLLPIFNGEIDVPVFSIIKWIEKKEDEVRVGVQFLT
jgi:hypothetical protein